MNDKLNSIAKKCSLFYRVMLIEIRTMYAGTFLGLAWVVIGPLILLALYSIIYAVIFNVRLPNYSVEEYILNLFSGLVPFLAFAQSLSAASSVMKKNQKYLYNTNIPIEFLPAKTVVVSYIILFVGFIIIFIGDLIWSKVSITWLIVPFVAFFQLLFSIGISFFLSLLSLLIKDLQQVVQYIVIAFLVVTPIAYTPDMIPEKLLPVLYGNPLFYYVISYQNLILLNEMPSLKITILGIVISLLTFVSGFFFFRKAKQIIMDLL